MLFASLKERTSFRAHTIEGALYLGTNSLLSPQTMFPALVYRLGGNDLAVGAIPVVVYLSYFLPQVFSANAVSKTPFRKPFVLSWGLAQRIQILLLAIAVGVLGNSFPSLALCCVFVMYGMSQATSGTISPRWADFVAKTVAPNNRGKLLGLRTSLGAVLGFLNGFVLVAFLAYIPFPWSYASVFGLAFLFQLSSVIAQRWVVEDQASRVATPAPIGELFTRVKKIIRTNHIYRRFLFASTLLTISLISVAFFTVAALKKFSLNESYVGLFTVITIAAQIVSGVVLGWLSDRRGNKIALLICAGSLFSATLLALLASQLWIYYIVFFFMGMNIGAETMLRYNFAVDCAPEDGRAMYVGLMNAWFAPFYLCNLLAGWLSNHYGYDAVFGIALVAGACGLALLWKTPEPRKQKLAVAPK
jgi:MFS family permease